MDPKTQTLRREGIPTILNPLDKHALEAALAIRDAEGGEVVLLSMAPPFAEATLREGLAMGADRAVLLSDLVFAGSDTLATSLILAAGCRWIKDFDMVLCGNLSVDGSTAQVCSQLAELLSLPNLMHVIAMEPGDKGQWAITQKIENGFVTYAARLPIVLSVRKEVNKPRYVPFTGILAAESKEIKVLSNADLGLDTDLLGLDGSPTKWRAWKSKNSREKKKDLKGLSMRSPRH